MQRAPKTYEGRVTPHATPIPASRDRMQSRVLVVFIGAMLVVSAVHLVRLGLASGQGRSSLDVAIGFSLTFGVLVWALRAATPAAALCGSVVCLLLSWSPDAVDHSLAHSGLPALLALFVLTFVVTRLGRARKQRLGLAEAAHGRNAAQVIANLGAAGLVAGLPMLMHAALRQLSGGVGMASVLILSALAEATADTLSSEIGQAFGGTPWLITRFQPVPPGTDGAITLRGTLAGFTGAAMVAAVGAVALQLSFSVALIASAAGIAGLFFDSLLGATLERRGWLGNDLVNFSSTVFAVLCAAILLRFWM